VTNRERYIYAALIAFLLVTAMSLGLAAVSNLDRLDARLGPDPNGHDPMGVRL
jgi:hypothetical protein